MYRIEPESWRADLADFKAGLEKFCAGEMDKGAYKGFSGGYGSYAQRGGKASMLRLRMPGGRVTKAKWKFIADSIARWDVKKAHFTTCQTLQLHDLGPEAVCGIMEDALDVGIVTRGGGGDFPRNVMCSPLSGVETGEYFDVLPWAEAAGEYLMHFIRAEKMPRKLKVGFSNTAANVTHATYRDLGFVARADGTFDVYSAGGLGNNPRMGVLVAEAVAPEKILYYIKAMWLTFRAYGNYENRGKARTRYMQEACGGPEAYAAAYRAKLEEVFASGEDLDLHVEPIVYAKQGNGTTAEGPRVVVQKQPGLYAVAYHPLGGTPDPAFFGKLYEVIADMPEVEARIAPDETVWFINLTGDEAQQVIDATPDSARSVFETSVACIGATVCQVGVQDSQALLAACVQAVRDANLPADALPKVRISGCPSSCGAHQTAAIGFNGTVKRVNNAPQPAFMVHLGGQSAQGCEQLGQTMGVMLQRNIPAYLVEVGRTAAAAGGFAAWRAAAPQALEELTRAWVDRE